MVRLVQLSRKKTKREEEQEYRKEEGDREKEEEEEEEGEDREYREGMIDAALNKVRSISREKALQEMVQKESDRKPVFVPPMILDFQTYLAFRRSTGDLWSPQTNTWLRYSQNHPYSIQKAKEHKRVPG